MVVPSECFLFDIVLVGFIKGDIDMPVSNESNESRSLCVTCGFVVLIFFTGEGDIVAIGSSEAVPRGVAHAEPVEAK